MEVDCAYDGEEAIEGEKKEYDVVLLDIMLQSYPIRSMSTIREFSSIPI